MLEGALSYNLWGVAGATLVMAIMQVIKQLWPTLKDRKVIAVSIGVAMVLSACATLYQVAEGTASGSMLKLVLDTLGAGLLVGLSAGGTWSAVKPRSN